MRHNLSRMYLTGVVAFILFLSTPVGVPVLPRLSQELGAKATEVPLVVSAAMVTVVIAQFLTGLFAMAAWLPPDPRRVSARAHS